MKYDLTRLEAVAEGDKDFIVKVLKVFITEVTADIQKMQDAFESEDLLDISKLAHKIKPNLILLGLDQATALSVKIEKNRFMGRNDLHIWLPKGTYSLIYYYNYEKFPSPYSHSVLKFDYQFTW